MRKYSWLKLLVFLVVVGVLSFSRQIFSFRYEPEYYENYFYNSQWNVPSSTRGISDGDLFKFVGYRLAEGENPFNIDYEVPPFGKYLYGVSEKYLGSPYWVSIGFYLGSLVVFYFVAKELFEKEINVWLTLFLFASTPFVATQIRDVMLDLPLMFMFLAHTLAFLWFLREKEIKYLALAGIFLGLAAGTKLGIYTPLALLLGSWFAVKVTKKFVNVVVLPVATGAGYVLAYGMYFAKHQNPIPWIRLHKKVYDFYSGSFSDIDYFNQLRTIFQNNYQGWWQPGEMIKVGDWSLVLPLGVVAAVVVLFFSWKKKENKWVYVSGLALVFLVMNNLVPFWPRYLMPAIPLFVLLIGYVFRKKGIILLLIALLNLPVLVTVMSAEDIPGHTQAAARFFSTRAYRELYRSITVEDRENIEEGVFIETMEEFFDQLGTRNVQIELGEVGREGNRVTVPYESRYETRYGVAVQEQVFVYTKVNGQWKLEWDWGYLWPGYGVESELMIDEGRMPLLGLKNEQGKVVARRGKGWEVYMIPRLMYDWNKSLGDLSFLTGISTLVIDARIKRVVPDDFPRYAGYFDPDREEAGIELAEETAGVILREVDYLVSVDGSGVGAAVRKVFETKPELFYVKAEVLIKSEDGENEMVFVGGEDEVMFEL